MLKGFRGTDGDIEPLEFECEVFGHPNLTTTGEKMYDNTHFRTKEEAWCSINRSWEAVLSLNASILERAKQNVDKWTKRLAEDALNYTKSKNKYNEYLSAQCVE